MDPTAEWHLSVDNISITTYVLDQEAVSEDELATLESSTRALLNQDQGIPQPIPPPEVDIFLAGLVNRHAGDRLSALCACLPLMSLDRSRELVAATAGTLNSKVYLKFIRLLEKCHSRVLSGPDIQVAGMLRTLVSLTIKDFDFFQRIYSTCVDDMVTGTRLIPAPFLSNLLHEIQVVSKAGAYLQKCMDERDLQKAFRSVSWLKGRRSIIDSAKFIETQPEAFPDWDMYRRWEPVVARISSWAKPGIITESQRRSLGNVFALEGPDITRGGFSSLREAMTEAVSSHAVPAASLPPASHLALLDRCFDAGSSAISLFIKHCATNPSDIRSWRLVNQAVSEGESAAIISAKKILLSRAEAESKRIEAVPLVLEHLGANTAADSNAVNTIEATALEVESLFIACLQRVSDLFRAGSYSEASIWTLWKLGQDIRACQALHAYIRGDLVVQAEGFPEENDLRAILQGVAVINGRAGLDRASRGQSKHLFLMDYLQAVFLGNPHDMGTANFEALMKEINFWKQPRQPKDIELAIALSLPPLNYPLYVDYFAEVGRSDSATKTLVLVLLHEPDSLALVSLMRQLVQQQQGFAELWYDLLVIVVNKHGQALAVRLSHSLSAKEFFDFITDTVPVLRQVQRKGLASSPGNGISSKDVDWWLSIGEGRVGKMFERLDNARKTSDRLGANCQIMFNASSQTRELVSHFQGIGDTAQDWILLAYLESDGSNSQHVLRCATAIQPASQSPRGRELTRRILDRMRGGASPWRAGALVTLLATAGTTGPDRPPGWAREELEFARAAHRMLRGSPQGAADLAFASDKLLSEFSELLDEAADLESERRESGEVVRGWQRRLLTNATRNSTRRRRQQDEIPEEFVNSVEVLGNQTYLISFDLHRPGATHELRMRGAGLSLKDRFWSVKVHIGRAWTVCVFSGLSDGSCSGRHCITDRNFQAGTVQVATCGCLPSLFAASLTSRAAGLVRNCGGDANDVFGGLRSFARLLWERCRLCYSALGAHVWSLSLCSRCEMQPLALAPQPDGGALGAAGVIAIAEADADATDLLLTSLYNAVVCPRAAHYLPSEGSPGLHATRVRGAIDQLPPLRGPLVAGGGTAAAALSETQKTVLAWVQTAFRGFLLRAPPSFQIPGLPGALQFLLANGGPSQQQQFAAALQRLQLPVGRLVFHGTTISNLFPILCRGLHPLPPSNGIWMAEEPSYSISGYSQPIGATWANSQFSRFTRFKVLLACELAESRQLNVHTIYDGSLVMVRYVLLVPQNQTPMRATVEEAFMSVFTQLHKYD